MVKFSKLSKKEKKDLLMKYLQIIIGTIILVIGQTVFIEQCVLIIGGLTSIGNIINVFIPSKYTVSITVVVLNIVCYIIGRVFLGKKFATQTLLSVVVYTIVYPIISALINNNIATFLVIPKINGEFSETTLLLASAFGGIISGAGIAMCMLGGGSTGGVDVFSVILAKYTKIKVAVWVFLVDAILVLLGYILVNHSLVYFLICILATICSSMTLNFIFTRHNNSYVVNIISKEWQKINDFIINNLDRGSTIINVQGGYKFEEYRMIQAAITRDQYSTLLNKISEIDKSAFVTITNAYEINGEGFQDFSIR